MSDVEWTFAILVAIGSVWIVSVFIWTAAQFRRVRAESARAWMKVAIDWPEHADKVSQDAFRRAYMRAHLPRAPIWRAVGVLILAGATPNIFLVLDLIWPLMMRMAVGRWLDDAYYLPYAFRQSLEFVPQAIGFFMIIGAWVLIATQMIRAYHRRRPGSLMQELDAVAGIERPRQARRKSKLKRTGA